MNKDIKILFLVFALIIVGVIFIKIRLWLDSRRDLRKLELKKLKPKVTVVNRKWPN